MAEYIFTVKNETNIVVTFDIQHDKPFRIGEKMNVINKVAYMNGYNWEAFLNYYLSKYAADVLVDMKTDPEAGTYVAYYSINPETEKRAEKLVKIIQGLLDNEEELFRIVREEGNNILWD